VNTSANYGRADWDRQNVLTFTHSWRLPFGTGTKYLSSGALGRILGPWQLDGIVTYASGLPFTPTGSTAICGCPGNTSTAQVVPGEPVLGFSYFPSYFGDFYYRVPTLLPTQNFVQAPAGVFGNLGRNSVRANNLANYDLSLSRSFVFVEQTRLEFRGEAYNLLNSHHFGVPISDVNSANFGQSTATPFGLGGRTIQLALKLVF
jgi:hypothetical protein